MSYDLLYVYNGDGENVGYVINKVGTEKIWGSNILNGEEVAEQLALLNSDEAIRANWPSLNDPDVQALINDVHWEPIEMQWAFIVDEANSHYVYVDHEFDPETGEPGTVDEEASVIAYKDQLIPVNPSDLTLRNKNAMEAVARRRAGLND